MNFKEAINVFIDFSIIESSNINTLKNELDLLISAGKLIYLWSDKKNIIEMELWSAQNGMWDYIWGYHIKDSSTYQKVDIVIDPDPTFVNKFTKRGKIGNVISKME